MDIQSLVTDQTCLEHKWPTYQCIVTTLQETIHNVLCCVVLSFLLFVALLFIVHVGMLSVCSVLGRHT